MDKVVPALRSKWPREDGRCTVRIQVDNAPPHSSSNKNDPWLVEWENLLSLPQAQVKMKVIEQLANSPDNNINDLSFFASLQSRYWQQTPATTIEGLIANVRKAYDEYDPERLNRIWLTHGAVLNAIISIDGGNNYSLPHLKKDQLARNGKLPSSFALGTLS